MPYEYTEDNLIEETAIDLFFNRLGKAITSKYHGLSKSATSAISIPDASCDLIL